MRERASGWGQGSGGSDGGSVNCAAQVRISIDRLLICCQSKRLYRGCCCGGGECGGGGGGRSLSGVRCHRFESDGD